MQLDNKIFADMAKMAGDAAGLLADIKREVEAQVKSLVQANLARVDAVPRAEFEAVKAMAEEARRQQEKLAARVEALERNLPKN